uniref:Uncharacterized protein n=1 Tax=Oryza punctata TaxID=4537 RepID=A0A0E0LZW9_ORYPU
MTSPCGFFDEEYFNDFRPRRSDLARIIQASRHVAYQKISNIYDDKRVRVKAIGGLILDMLSYMSCLLENIFQEQSSTRVGSGRVQHHYRERSRINAELSDQTYQQRTTTYLTYSIGHGRTI